MHFLSLPVKVKMSHFLLIFSAPATDWSKKNLKMVKDIDVRPDAAATEGMRGIRPLRRRNVFDAYFTSTVAMPCR
jgi:hypothetical protein